MKLIVAGASHGVPEKHRFCTSLFLQVGENTYIIDAGAPISALLDHYDIPHKTVKGVFYHALPHRSHQRSAGILLRDDVVDWLSGLRSRLFLSRRKGYECCGCLGISIV